MGSRSFTSLVLAVASVVLFLAGFVFLAFYVTSVTGPHLRYLGAGFLAACAAFVIGCLVGLIVGIPRFVSSGAMRHAIEAKVARSPARPPAPRPVVVQAAPVDPAAAQAAQAAAAQAAQAAQGPQPVQGAMAPMAPMTPMTLVASGPQQQPARTTDPDGFPALTDTDQGGTGTGADDQGDAGQVSQLTPSTNLAEISDWLTKLLLGAGLVELTRLGHPLSSLIDAVARGLQGVPAGGAVSGTPVVVAGSILVMYVVLGFLDGYIVTTLWYGKYLQRLGYN
jgi:hypothetical protein